VYLAFECLVSVGLVPVSVGGAASDRAGGLASDTLAASRCSATDAAWLAWAASAAGLGWPASSSAESCWAGKPQPGGGAIVSCGASPPIMVSLGVENGLAEVSGCRACLRTGSTEALLANGVRCATSGRFGEPA
jgi:hypothetical protein